MHIVGNRRKNSFSSYHRHLRLFPIMIAESSQTNVHNCLSQVITNMSPRSQINERYWPIKIFFLTKIQNQIQRFDRKDQIKATKILFDGWILNVQ